MKPLVVHVSAVELGEESGMGRVSWHWQRACEERGWELVHLGPSVVGRVPHPALFPRAAWRAYRSLRRRAALFLAHEPLAAPFVRRGIPLVVFSHGLERRRWEVFQRTPDWATPIAWRTRILFPLWRLRPCDIGLQRADAVLLINQEDAQFAAGRYGIPDERRWVFQNGVYPMASEASSIESRRLRILFLGSWIGRKGTRTLTRAAAELAKAGIDADWILAGVGQSTPEVLSGWPAELADATTVVPSFSAADEAKLLRGCDVLVLPSFFEGQPLSLLQAMEAGRCCITTDCCGQRDLIRHRDNGLLHAPGDAGALTQLLIDCSRDPGMRREIGLRAKASVRDRSWPIVAARVAEQLDSVMRTGRLLRERAIG